MQRDENLVYINNGVNGQQIDAIHMGYRHTGAVYTRPVTNSASSGDIKLLHKSGPVCMDRSNST